MPFLTIFSGADGATVVLAVVVEVVGLAVLGVVVFSVGGTVKT